MFVIITHVPELPGCELRKGHVSPSQRPPSNTTTHIVYTRDVHSVITDWHITTLITTKLITYE